MHALRRPYLYRLANDVMMYSIILTITCLVVDCPTAIHRLMRGFTLRKGNSTQPLGIFWMHSCTSFPLFPIDDKCELYCEEEKRENSDCKKKGGSFDFLEVKWEGLIFKRNQGLKCYNKQREFTLVGRKFFRRSLSLSTLASLVLKKRKQSKSRVHNHITEIQHMLKDVLFRVLNSSLDFRSSFSLEGMTNSIFNFWNILLQCKKWKLRY